MAVWVGRTLALAAIVAAAAAVPTSADAAKPCEGGDAYTYDVRLRADGVYDWSEIGGPRTFLGSFTLAWEWQDVRIASDCRKKGKVRSLEVLTKKNKDVTIGTVSFEVNDNTFVPVGQSQPAPCSWTQAFQTAVRLSLIATDVGGGWNFQQRAGVMNFDDTLYMDTYRAAILEAFDAACPNRSLSSYFVPIDDRHDRAMQIFGPEAFPFAQLDLEATGAGEPVKEVGKLFRGKDTVIKDSWAVERTDSVWFRRNGFFFEVVYDRHGR